MARTPAAPTPSELEVLKQLWRQGGKSARELHQAIGAAHDWAYSTTRTTLERMVKKGLLARREFHGLHLYEPAVGKPATLAGIARDFARRVLELDSGALVPLFARSQGLTRAELAELERLLREEPARRRR